MNRPVYPNALILAHPQMTAASAIEVARRDGLLLVHNPRTGNYRYEFPHAMTNGQRAGGAELAGSRGCGKAGFANCGMRTPGANSQQNGVTAARGCNQSERGNFALTQPAAPRFPARAGRAFIPFPVADAAGHTPEAA